ncbi:zinc ribbon domain-containing protein [Halomicrobium sp. LC1Hm]|uniref:zinc ribbon domain-containing protein n=1 Tax=Halomicrobium sp. LC1Hm TaxID=2610902 RepID=UPI0012982998|nr:zinc ribbon domain-containing protein [Halomicrobium sp. LC1Hm]QGA82384.1 HEAT repeats containing protein [Halomicrobium sp. LC1Hm]
MVDRTEPPEPARLVEIVETEPVDRVRDALTALAAAPPSVRKDAVQALGDLAGDAPSRFDGLAPVVASFLTDEERAIRLTTAKLFVAVAEADPDAVLGAVDALGARLADEDEFYYVRARSAEALGYAALEYPDAVAAPEVLADLRVGLAFDEPEVTAKLAKALAFVALGDPDRLRHLVEHLGDHLDAESELVRYHVCTALVATGCEHPERLADVRGALAARLDDPNPYVRGRAAEAFGTAGADVFEDYPTARLRALADDEESFVTERGAFAAERGRSGDRRSEESDLGTIASLRRTTGSVIEELTTADAVDDCPHCGAALPESGPPMCPQCGAPR